MRKMQSFYYKKLFESSTHSVDKLNKSLISYHSLHHQLYLCFGKQVSSTFTFNFCGLNFPEPFNNEQKY